MREEFDDYEKEDDHPPIIINKPVIVHETERALLVQQKRGKFWVPKRCIIERCDDVLAIVGTFDRKYLPD